MARQTLGRGLSALMGGEAPAMSEGSTFDVDMDLIDPNPQQPRTTFTDNELDELAQSIRENGVIQPVVVRRSGGRYQLVAGERRWRASQRAELRRIPAVVREVSDEKLLELALIENIQRQQLNPIEEARAYLKLLETLGLTQEQVAHRVGKDRTMIATALRLLRLPGEIQTMMERGAISAGHGRALLTTDDETRQLAVARLICEKGLSVRETERIIKQRQASGQSKNLNGSGGDGQVDPNVKAAETRLIRRLSTNVKIVPARSGAGGKIEIEYYNTDDLNRIYEAILSN